MGYFLYVIKQENSKKFSMNSIPIFSFPHKNGWIDTRFVSELQLASCSSFAFSPTKPPSSGEQPKKMN